MKTKTDRELVKFLRECWYWCDAHGIDPDPIAREPIEVGTKLDLLIDGWADLKTPAEICAEVFNQSSARSDQ